MSPENARWILDLFNTLTFAAKAPDFDYQVKAMQTARDELLGYLSVDPADARKPI